jgi:glycosyltransferase involved in cell wall biosynthesis
MEAFAEMPELTLVVVGSAPDSRGPGNIRQFVDVSDTQLRWLYASAAGLLACSREDFGLTPVEAFAFGTPVAAIAEGGYLETCVNGVTGTWLDISSKTALRASIRRFSAATWDADAIRRHGEEWSPTAFRRALLRHVRHVVSDEHPV